jgi:transcriptional regulator with XRE-family HTH domain
MFDDRVGPMLRALRIRRGLRQVDVARLAHVSPMTVSRLERGQFESLTVRVVRRVARVLEVRMDFAPWSRHGDLHRFATAEHAGLVEGVVTRLVELGWAARAEVSFSSLGERGFIDVLAWHAASATLLAIEVKTEIVDVGETLGTFDRKRRLAAAIGREMGWLPRVVAAALIVEDTTTNRRRVADHAATVRSQLPEEGRQMRAFLRHPERTRAARTGPGDALSQRGEAREGAAGVIFWSNNHPGIVRRARPGARRVRRANSCSLRVFRGSRGAVRAG